MSLVRQIFGLSSCDVFSQTTVTDKQALVQTTKLTINDAMRDSLVCLQFGARVIAGGKHLAANLYRCLTSPIACVFIAARLLGHSDALSDTFVVDAWCAEWSLSCDQVAEAIKQIIDGYSETQLRKLCDKFSTQAPLLQERGDGVVARRVGPSLGRTGGYRGGDIRLVEHGVPQRGARAPVARVRGKLMIDASRCFLGCMMSSTKISALSLVVYQR